MARRTPVGTALSHLENQRTLKRGLSPQAIDEYVTEWDLSVLHYVSAKLPSGDSGAEWKKGGCGIGSVCGSGNYVVCKPAGRDGGLRDRRKPGCNRDLGGEAREH